MDVDDIRPGENFVQKLEETEHASAALVVVIGTTWVNQRLHDPEDFVRREIARGLRENLKVLPLLVQGAKMPQAMELPDEIAALALLQAIEVRDERFQRDAADLVEALRQVVTIAPPASENWAGTWQATVNYSWGDAHKEMFRFEVDDNDLLGTASYIGLARAICDGKIGGKKISFFTKSVTLLADKTYEEKHVYSGKLTDGTIVFRLQTDTGYDTRLPETFTAVRVQGN
jgi:hypothetical protein